jgi:hypothetical protein
MKTNNKKNGVMHKVNKDNVDRVSANNKMHHINSSVSPSKKTGIKNKDIFLMNVDYDNFFTKLMH